MNKNPNQPRKFDAVLGGQAPPPVEGVVLGGIEGVKNRLQSTSVEVQVAALSDALNYGEPGIDLIIETLYKSSDRVQDFAARILRKNADSRVKEMVLDFDPWLAFTMMTNWSVEDFVPEVGITDPLGTAYALNVQLDYQALNAEVQSLPSPLPFTEEEWRFKIKELEREQVIKNKKLQVFLQTSQSHQIQALCCYYPSHCFLDLFVEAKDQLSNIKAIFWGNPEDNPYKDCRYELTRNMSLILEAYPTLEVLHIRGNASGDTYERLGSGLTFTPLQHDRLKTLIIETSSLFDLTIDQIVALDLPNLEYLELWLGHGNYDGYRLVLSISEQFPNLKYLGIRSCKNADEVARALINSSLVQRLKVLDLSMGTMTILGVEHILKCFAVNKLHTLNVSMNVISNTEELDKLTCRVIAQPQDSKYGERYNALDRYYNVSYE